MVGGGGLMWEICFVVGLRRRLVVMLEGNTTLGEQAMFGTEDRREC